MRTLALAAAALFLSGPTWSATSVSGGMQVEVSLTDLNPDDGMAPSITWAGYGDVFGSNEWILWGRPGVDADIVARSNGRADSQVTLEYQGITAFHAPSGVFGVSATTDASQLFAQASAGMSGQFLLGPYTAATFHYRDIAFAGDLDGTLGASGWVYSSIYITSWLPSTRYFDVYEYELPFQDTDFAIAPMSHSYTLRNPYATNSYVYETSTVIQLSLQPVPEPASVAMTAVGLLGLAGLARRRNAFSRPGAPA